MAHRVTLYLAMNVLRQLYPGHSLNLMTKLKNEHPIQNTIGLKTNRGTMFTLYCKYNKEEQAD